MLNTPKKIPIFEEQNSFQSKIMEKTFKISIKGKDIITAIILILLICFEVSAICNFVWGGGLEYSVSVMLFKISMCLLGFLLLLYLIVILFIKDITNDVKCSEREIKLIKDAAYQFNKRMERLNFYDKTAVKEKIKKILVADDLKEL